MEALNSASLGAMRSLVKLDKLLRGEVEAARKSSIQQLRDDVDNIRTKLVKLSEVHDPPLTVTYWMKDARELSYDMEDCVDQFILRAGDADAQTDWPNEISGFQSRAMEVIERYGRFNLGYVPTLPAATSTVISYRLGNGVAEIVSMEDRTEEFRLLVESSKQGDDGNENRQLKVVSILGVQGIGKTTLAQKLWRQMDGKFDCRAFVQTSKKPDMRNILRSILSQVRSLKTPQACFNVPNLIRELRKHLQEKRYIVIIEDLWSVSVWDVVRHAFPEGNCCSRVIITTTIEDVALACCSYDPEHIFKMKSLSGDHSKELFIRTVFGSGNGCPQELHDVSGEISRKCGGLPLALICIATLVTSQPDREQLGYAKKFLYNNLKTNSTSVEILNQVLQLCYGSLPRFLKTCLLYLSMYPENYLILKEDLVKQWIAEGFVCTTEGMNAVDVASGYFDELIRLSLIQRMDIVSSNEKGLLSYAVHPVVFDFITCKSMEDNFVTIIDHSQSTAVFTEKIRRLSLNFGSATYATVPASLNLSLVRSLVFMGLLGCMPSIAELKFVRVVILHIWSDDGDTRFSLAEICKLLLLRYLQVKCNVFVELPRQMGCLKHLETLEINSRITAVPSDIFRISGLLHVRFGAKTNLTLGTDASVKAISSDDFSSVPSPPLFLVSFELLPPICTFWRLPDWIGQLHKLCILEIVVRELWMNDINILAELPVLTSLSLYVRTHTRGNIVFRRGAFPALVYLKFVCGVLLLDFKEEAMPNLRRLKVGFNARREGQYEDMLVGIENVLNLEKISVEIGAAIGAEESDWSAAESAFKDGIEMHACHLSSEVKRVDPFVEEYDHPSEKQNWSQQKGTSHEHGDVSMYRPPCTIT